MMPRFYAIEMLRMNNKKEAFEYMKKDVPPIWHDIIITYMRMWWNDRDEIIKKIDARKAQNSRNYK